MHQQDFIQRLSYFTLRQSNEVVFWIDETGTIRHVNQAACKFSGFAYGEIVGKKIYGIHPDEDVNVWRERWERLKKHKRLQFEKWQPRRDGRMMRLLITQNYIEFEGKAYTVSLIADKTKEYEMQAKIRESERRLATLMGNLPGMAYRCRNDAAWTMEFVSEGCFKLTGYRTEALTMNTQVAYNSIILPEDRNRIRDVVKKQLHRRGPFEVKYRIKQASGDVRWVWERGTGVLDENGAIAVIEGFVTDITAMKKAEQELIEKEQSLRELKDRLKEETIYLREEIKTSSNFDAIISKSQKFRQVLKQVEQVATTGCTVLVLGETGTGKELVARALHNNSHRSDRSLVTVNCAALPAEMIESELFGHEKGAFTGAYTQKSGRFELAHGGTIFLDEIGELPLNLQTKLLRVLQEGEFQRLGNSKTTKIDARVIAATNRNLEEAVRKGEFREDLFYRLNVFPIEVPPLRERKEDIPLLVKHFIKKYAAKTGRPVKETSQKVMNHLMAYDWPGNVRELENIIERAVVLSRDGRITAGDWLPVQKPGTAKTIVTLAENERQHILRALKATNWRVSGEKGAAKILGMKRTTLEARMKKLGIEKPG